jgi:hypothetical protein
VYYDGSVLKGLYPLVRCHTKNVQDNNDRKPKNKELMTLNLQSTALCSVCTKRKTISVKKTRENERDRVIDSVILYFEEAVLEFDIL